ncbi:MAG TPA: hypothetical protein DCQ06_02805, partial [Myxococcales bacterium]|nr:hypothetical protein [Myxococcales bacterium]
MSFDNLSGDLSAEIIKPKLLSAGSDIRLLPTDKGALTVKLQDGKPHQYRGGVKFSYKDFAEGSATVAGPMLNFDTLNGESSLKVVKEFAIRNQGGMTLQKGGALAVTIENSTINSFGGKSNVKYVDWVEGVIDAKAGSSFINGITGRGSGKLTGTPTLQQSNDLKMAKGGTAVLDFVSGTAPTDFEVGSLLNWDLGGEQWLAGTMNIRQKTPIASISGPSPATVLSEKALPNSDPAMSLLPSEGLTVTWANNTLMNYQGSVKARVDGWVEGTLAIGGVATSESFSGDLTGKLSGNKTIGNLKLVPGGNVVVDVMANNPRFIKGDIPFNYVGSPLHLGGIVKSQESQRLQAISGTVAGAQVLETKQTGGGFSILPGGNINTTMTNSVISKIGGAANFEWGDQGTPWVKGALNIEGEANPFSMNGEFAGSIIKETPVGADLKLMPGAGLRGKVQNNTVTGIAGSIAFDVGDWLEGVVEVENNSLPTQLSGTAVVAVMPGKEHHVQGNAYMVAGSTGKASFDAVMANSAITQISGNIPWRLEDWIRGVANVASGTLDSIVGQGPGEIVGPGKVYSEGAPKQVKVHPGAGLTVVDLDADGNVTYSGAVQAEFGLSNGETLHIGRGGTADQVKGASFKGTVSGGLITPLNVEPKLALRSGGDLTVNIEGSNTPVSGTFSFGWGGPNKAFLLGSVEVANQNNLGQLAGNITTATVNEEQTKGKIKIKRGGDVHGDLVNPNDVKLKGGTFGYQYSDWLDGTITIHGDLAFSDDEGGFNGEGIGVVTRDLDMGAGFVLMSGSELQGEYQNSELVRASGIAGIRKADELEGSVIIETTAGDPPVITGHAQLAILKDMEMVPGLVIHAGSGGEGRIDNNIVGELHGQASFTAMDEVKGVAEGRFDIETQMLDGEGSATMLKAHPLSGSTMIIEPGGSLSATVVQSQLADVRGTLNWSYGDLGWLKGTVNAQSGDLDNVTGEVTGQIAIERYVDEMLRIKKGGGFKAQFDGTSLTGFSGTIGAVYDGWIDGSAKISGGDLQKLEGEVTATTLLRKDLKGGAFLKPGASIKANFSNSRLDTLSGSFGWQLDQWLEGA